LQSPILISIAEKTSTEDSIIKRIEAPDRSMAGLFSWTLTHRPRAFSEITPFFDGRNELLEYVGRRIRLTKNENSMSADWDDSRAASEEITRLAVGKVDREWRAWVDVHAELPFDEHRLDNMLMTATYGIILDRDGKLCVLCGTTFDLTIHHIIQKRRNVYRAEPPFGRSVPTNLITLCRICHSFFDPMIH
jgi:hypothetical protein